MSIAPDLSQSLPLQFLPTGRSAWVDELFGAPEQIHRLEELGMRPGTRIEMVQAGSPCIVRLGSSKFCFREADLLNVLVRLGDAP